MIALFTLFSLAFAGETCELKPLPVLPDRTAIAWVSPLGQRVGGAGWLTAIPVSELEAWRKSEAKPTVARLVQHVGLRKRGSDPKRKYKVVIFDVSAPLLCRPIGGLDEGDVVDGLRACPSPAPAKRTDGCGFATDHLGGEPGPSLVRVRWRDAARNGFCVLPAERWIEGNQR